MEASDLILVASLLAVLLFSAIIHEMAHAGAALYFGDTTAKEQGRLTLNPIPHIDPFMSILVPVMLYFLAGFAFGGAKPVPVDASRFRKGVVAKRAMLWVSLAGPVSNFILSFLLYYVAYQAAESIGYSFRTWLLWDILMGGAFLNILLGIFNLIPIPPLDGSKVVAGLLPDRAAALIYSLERFALPMLAIVAFLVFSLSAMLPMETVMYPFLKAAELLSGAAEAIVI